MKTGSDDKKKLWEMIKGISICMLTTVDSDGSLRSRPMDTQQVEFDGDLWFFAKDNSPKAGEIRNESQVNLSYMNKSGQEYISVSGIAAVIKDKEKIEELWNSLLKAYFPDGKNDPELTMIKVSVEKAEYWDMPSNAIVHFFNVAKAAVTGEDYDAGDNKKLSF